MGGWGSDVNSLGFQGFLEPLAESHEPHGNGGDTESAQLGDALLRLEAVVAEQENAPFLRRQLIQAVFRKGIGGIRDNVSALVIGIQHRLSNKL